MARKPPRKTYTKKGKLTLRGMLHYKKRGRASKRLKKRNGLF